jgi:hypothetical protein
VNVFSSKKCALKRSPFGILMAAAVLSEGDWLVAILLLLMLSFMNIQLG